MLVSGDDTIYSVVREEHMAHNDFFLRYLEFIDEPLPSEMIMTCLAGGRACYEIRYEREEIARRFQYGKAETVRYRQSSLKRILGRSHNLQDAFMHEYFSFFSSEAVTELVIQAKCGGETREKSIRVAAYRSRNRYRSLSLGPCL